MHYLERELLARVSADRSLFEFIQSSTLDGMWFWDLENPDVEWMNADFWLLLGFDPAEKQHLASERQDLINPDDLEVALDNFRRHCEDPSHPYDQIVRYTHRDGSTVWVRCRGIALRDEDGKPIRMLGAHNDITELMHAQDLGNELAAAKDAAERERDENADFLSAVLDNISDGIVACDADGVLSLFNKATRTFHGLPEEEIAPDKWADHYDLFMPDGETPMKMPDIPLLRALTENEVRKAEMVIAPKGMRRRHLVANGNAIFNADGDKIGAVVSMRDITDQWEAERRLRESEHRFQSAFESAGHGIALVGLDGTWLDVNQALCEIVGYSREELLKIDFQTITHPEDLDADLENVKAVIDGKIPSYEMEKRYIRKDGSEVPIILSVGMVRDADGAPLHFVSQIVDISAWRAAEQKLVQAQKMEAVGQLTGGVAHDFNNLLTVILGNLELIERKLVDDEKGSRQVELAKDAASRGADLTRRLLAFARRQILAPVVVNLNDNLREMMGLLQQSVGETIVIRADMSSDLWPTKIDPIQFETSILNLVINSRDAMAIGGVVAIATRNVSLDEAFAKQEVGLSPGEYVCVSVTDSGVGIPTEEIERVIEPFYSTKDVGKGTGLGLSMTYGFLKQSGGNLSIYSETGRGTSVRLYFPAEVDGVASENSGKEPHRDIMSGHEELLIVEDDPSVRATIAAGLEDRGYRVLEAGDAHAALEILHGDSSIDLMVTDVVMPGGMNGFELLAMARELRPTMKVLVTSGYPQTSFSMSEINRPGVAFVSKPYERDALSRQVRELLDHE